MTLTRIRALVLVSVRVLPSDDRAGGRAALSLRVASLESPRPQRHPALLILSDSDYPGWRATVDGVPADILRANGLYRAVKLSGGLQRVVFDYVPGSLQVGGAISFASLVSIVGVALATWLRGRARGK